MNWRASTALITVVFMQTAAFGQTAAQTNKGSGWVEDEEVNIAQPQPTAAQGAPLLAAPRRMQPSPMYQQFYQKYFASDDMDDDDDTGFGGRRKKQKERKWQTEQAGAAVQRPYDYEDYYWTQQGFGSPMYVGPELYNPYARYFGGPAYVTPGGGALPPLE